MSGDDRHDDGRPDDRLQLSSDAMWRYLVVGRVLAREAGGQVRADAVAEVAEQFHERLDGRRAARRSRATIYRWLAAYERGGVQALRRSGRARCEGSRVLPADLLAFVRAEKRADVRASVPELIRRAREKGVIGPDERVHRSTLWRACRRLGIPTRRRRMPKGRDSRRFAFPHRLDMVLCDGKHFRAGPDRARRVALFFLDDCTRTGLHVVVGTSESRELFLRGLHGLVRRHGRFSAIYTDNGSGFVGTTIADVVRRLGAHIVLGTAGYPEGRGKVERFNLSAQQDLLRHLPGRTDVSDDCASLELRLAHYLRDVYNHRPHSALADDTPSDRFHGDDKPLRFLDDATLRNAFVVHVQRRVSSDHVVSLDGVHYEVPRGHAGERITLHRRLLDGTVAVLHDGRLHDIRPVDPAANARSRRGTGRPTEDAAAAPTRGAADIAFLRTLGPIVGPDGGFTDHDDDQQETP